MTHNPYMAPTAPPDDARPEPPPTRVNLAAAIRSFVAGEMSTFQLEDRLDAYLESGDPVIRLAIEAALFYCDESDRFVCLSKQEWDFFQRLLLLLHSDNSVDIRRHREWSATQVIAGTSLAVYVYCAVQIGWGYSLLLLSIPFGLISMALTYARKSRPLEDPYRDIIYPFATLSDLESAYRSANFQKERYPKAHTDRTRKSPLIKLFGQIQQTIIWLLLSPVPLLIQSLPATEIRSHAVAR